MDESEDPPGGRFWRRDLEALLAPELPEILKLE